MIVIRIVLTLLLLVVMLLFRRRRLFGTPFTLLAGVGLHRVWRSKKRQCRR
ncbi:MAG: hypothetical protein ACRDT1_09830 [Micromonosporaceae bacterium]